MFEVIDFLSFGTSIFHSNTCFFFPPPFCLLFTFLEGLNLKFLSSLEITIFLASHIILFFHQNLSFDQSECDELCKQR